MIERRKEKEQKTQKLKNLSTVGQGAPRVPKSFPLLSLSALAERRLKGLRANRERKGKIREGERKNGLVAVFALYQKKLKKKTLKLSLSLSLSLLGRRPAAREGHHPDHDGREGDPSGDVPPKLRLRLLPPAADAAAATAARGARAAASPDLRRVQLLLQLLVQLGRLRRHLQRLAVHLRLGVLGERALEAPGRPPEQGAGRARVGRQEALRREGVAQTPERVMLLGVDCQGLVELGHSGGDLLVGLSAVAEVGELEERAAPPGEGLVVVEGEFFFEVFERAVFFFCRLFSPSSIDPFFTPAFSLCRNASFAVSGVSRNRACHFDASEVNPDGQRNREREE